jgi:hypothetical protein
MYLLLLESLFSLGFVWTFHWKPEFAQASGFWICAVLTAIVTLVALGFEILGFFGTPKGQSPRWWHSFLRTAAYLAVAAYPLWRIWPFAVAAWIGWDANP